MIKKPHSTFLSKKNDLLPFGDETKIEFLADKNESAHFVFGSHNKKRPNNMIMGRVFDGHVLDMFEFGVENLKTLNEFKIIKTSVGSKPILTFAGDAFDTQFEYMRLKNFLIDFFTGPKTDGVRLAGLESVVSITAIEGKIHMRHYKIILKKSGLKIPRVELEEMGPRFDLVLRRHKIASDDHFKHSLKQPYQLNPKKSKNVNISQLGTTFGRVHMERQDYSKLNTRKMKGLKKTFDEAFKIPAAPPQMAESLDKLAKMNPTKKFKGQ